MKKVMKRIGIILLCVLGVVIVVAAVLLIKNIIHKKEPWIKDDYYNDFKSDSDLELKYAGLGSYEVSNTTFKSDDDLKNIRIWYPSEMDNSNQKYSVIIVTNASNIAALNYQAFFNRLASWGFIVVGNDDRQTGTGSSTSQTLDFILEQNNSKDSLFFGKIDEDNIGIIGYSQGGAGAIRAVTEYANSNRYKALFTGSASYAYLAEKMWEGYDASKVSVPWFMTAGTGTTEDSGVPDITTEFGGVAPLSSLIDNYNAMDDNVFKIRARVKGAEHEDMLQRPDGYMTAWMLYQLQGDAEAGTVFIGDNAEILKNEGWQDVEKNK